VKLQSFILRCFSGMHQRDSNLRFSAEILYNTSGGEIRLSVAGWSTVQLLVTDLRRSVSFYESLGFQRAVQSVLPDESGSFVLLEAPSPPDLLLVRGDGGGATGVVIVLDVRDLGEMLAQLVASGTPVRETINPQTGRSVMHIFDPDGYGIEFVEGSTAQPNHPAKA